MMETTQVQKLARVLNVLVTLALCVNVLVLIILPAILYYDPNGLLEGTGALVDEYLHPEEDDIVMAWVFFYSWLGAFMEPATYHLGVCLFLLVCGLCTADILRQARRVLATILAGNPFQMANAQALRRAAVCCWIISGAALVRLILWLWAEKNLAPLFAYNALFVPAFFMGGLLFQVMSALFRQAAELKEDQDLTI